MVPKRTVVAIVTISTLIALLLGVALLVPPFTADAPDDGAENKTKATPTDHPPKTTEKTPVDKGGGAETPTTTPTPTPTATDEPTSTFTGVGGGSGSGGGGGGWWTPKSAASNVTGNASGG